jgi:hypothetical protein
LIRKECHFGSEKGAISEDLARMAKEGTAASSSATNFEGHWNARMLDQIRTSISLDPLIITPSRSHSLFQTPSATMPLHARLYGTARRNIQENRINNRKKKGRSAGAEFGKKIQ